MDLGGKSVHTNRMNEKNFFLCDMVVLLESGIKRTLPTFKALDPSPVVGSEK